MLNPFDVGSDVPVRLCFALTPITPVKILRHHNGKIFCGSRRIFAGIAAPMTSICNTEMRKIFPCGAYATL